MEVLILGVNTMYMLFCFFELFPIELNGMCSSSEWTLETGPESGAIAILGGRDGT